jgi:hypothetical protein
MPAIIARGVHKSAGRGRLRQTILYGRDRNVVLHRASPMRGHR